MKHNKITKTVSLALCFVLGFGMLGISASAAEAKTEARAAVADPAFDANDIVFTIAALSDTHIGFGDNEAIMDSVLKEFKTYTKNEINAVVFAGDQTQDGTRPQAQAFSQILRNNFDVSKIPMIFAHGNHDVYWSGCMTRAEFVSAYGEDMYQFDKDMAGAALGNRHIEVGGYHFLTVDIETYMPNYNTLSATTETWLKNKLDQITAKDSEKHVFVVCHSPAMDTTYGSMSDDIRGTGEWGASRELDTILKNYPQVVLLTGHTHYGTNLETNINQSSYTQMNLGSATDTEYEHLLLENRRSYSFGALLEIDSNDNIRITRIDFLHDSVIKQPWYIDAYKAGTDCLSRYSKETRLANNRAPQFPGGVQVTEVSASELRIDFKAASDDDMVYYYDIWVEDAAGRKIVSRQEVTPFYDYPTLVGMPANYSFTLTGNFEYPYTVKVRAYDCFGAYGEYTEQMVDKTSENTATAQKYDAAIERMLGLELTKDDLATVKGLRDEINRLNYKVVAMLTKLSAFEEFEREYYNTYFVTDCADTFAPAGKDVFSLVPLSSKGWAEASDNVGVSLNWNGGTKNYILGFDGKYELDGLHIGMTNLSIASENKTLGMIISNEKAKWTGGDALLLTVDFATGAISVNEKTQIGRSDLLAYHNLGGTPFDFKFAVNAEGGIDLTVSTASGSESFAIGAQSINGLTKLTDPDACYVSFSTWSSQTSMSLDVTAIHTEEPVVEPDPDDNPVDPEIPGDGEAVSIFGLLLELFVLIFSAIAEIFGSLFG